MTYKEILQELEELGFKEKFTSDIEEFIKPSVLERIKSTDKIHSTGSLLRHLISLFEYKSDKWEYWASVLHYFMTPDFVKDKNKLPN